MIFKHIKSPYIPVLALILGGIFLSSPGCLARHTVPPPLSLDGYQEDEALPGVYYDRTEDPLLALIYGVVNLPAWEKGSICKGRVQDEEGRAVAESLVVFKRRDRMGTWKVSVIEPGPEGGFSFSLEAGSRDWEIAVLGPKLGGISRVLGESTHCPPFDFVVRVLEDPDQLQSYREEWLNPYVKSLLALEPGAVSERDKNILLSLITPESSNPD